MKYFFCLRSTLIYCLTITLLLLSCEKIEQKDEGINYSINLDTQIKNEIPFLEIFEEVEIIPLETSKKSMIQKITKFEISNNRIYVLDARQRTLCIFDTHGNFIKKIQSIGKGPEEYLEITDFNINKSKKQIELLSPLGNMITYDLNGIFIKKNKLKLGKKIVHRFANISEDIICFYSFFSKKKITVYSRAQNKILYEDIESPSSEIDGTVLMSASAPFHENGKTAFFLNGLDRQILKPTKDKLVKVGGFDFGKHNLDHKYLKEVKGSFLEKHEQIKELSSKFVVSFCSYEENENFTVTSFAFKETFINLIVNKETKKKTLFTMFSNQIVFPSQQIKLYGDTLVTTTEPSMLYHYIPANNSIVKCNKNLDDFEINDNPVLIKYKLKM